MLNYEQAMQAYRSGETRRALLAYRSDPTDRNFSRVFDTMFNVVHRHLQGKVRVMKQMDRVQEVVWDAAYNLMGSVALEARRYLFECPICGAVFVEGVELYEHGRDVHGMLGLGPKVQIEVLVNCVVRQRVYKAIRSAFLYTPDDLYKLPSYYLRNFQTGNYRKHISPLDREFIDRIYGSYNPVGYIERLLDVKREMEQSC